MRIAHRRVRILGTAVRWSLKITKCVKVHQSASKVSLSLLFPCHGMRLNSLFVPLEFLVSVGSGEQDSTQHGTVVACSWWRHVLSIEGQAKMANWQIGRLRGLLLPHCWLSRCYARSAELPRRSEHPRKPKLYAVNGQMLWQWMFHDVSVCFFPLNL